MTGRRWAVVFAAGVLAVLGALSWVTAHTLRLERSERTASNEARHQELVRLVLWRMDSALTPIIAREAARPYFEYQPFYPVDTRFARQAASEKLRDVDLRGALHREAGNMGDADGDPSGTGGMPKLKFAEAKADPARKAEVGYGSTSTRLGADAPGQVGFAATQTMVPSPLLSPTEPHVRLYFEQDANGVRTSPQIPEGQARRLADAAYVTEYSLALAEDRLLALNSLLNPETPQVTPTAPSVPPGTPGAALAEAGVNQQIVNTDPAPAASDAVYKQNISEYRARQQATQFANRVDEPRKAARRDGNVGLSKENEVASNTGEPGGEKAPTGNASPAEGDATPRGEPPADELASKPASPPAPAAGGNDAAGSGPVAPVTASAGRDEGAVGKTQAARPSVAAAPAAQADRASGGVRTASKPSGTKSDNKSPAAPAASVPPVAASSSAELPRGTVSMDSASSLAERALSDLETGSASAAAPAPPDARLDSADVSGVSVRQGQFAARWIVRPGQTPELIFEREMDVGDRHFTQGIWLDWPALKQMLLDTAQGLLPSIDLVPILDLAAIGPDDLVLGRTLAAIPVELIAPAPVLADQGEWTPARTALALMWIAVVGAIIAAGASLTAAAELAQRRGQFVSAVTHELRTPLTTFCLYSQMLADGIVTDTDAQKGYFQTLKNESTRLARIVESVLDYARLSGRSVTRVATETSIDSLVAALDRVLRARCEQSGMHLDVKVDPGVRGSIRTDHTIVERILFNLVENACKYAAESQDPTIHLNITGRGDSWLEFTVQDHGPGIDPAEHSRIFRPFIRGSRQAHGGIPGLGLGLALAQGLARELGGELELKAAGEGACFVLRLPIAAA